jgi:hypothetical protein
MMKNPAARGHPACGNDHEWHVILVDFFRLSRGSRNAGDSEQRPAFRGGEPVVTNVFLEYAPELYGAQRAVRLRLALAGLSPFNGTHDSDAKG